MRLPIQKWQGHGDRVFPLKGCTILLIPVSVSLRCILIPNNRSGREIASKRDVSVATLNRILKGISCVGQEMALRLAKALGRSAESWLAMQDNYDLW